MPAAKRCNWGALRRRLAIALAALAAPALVFAQGPAPLVTGRPAPPTPAPAAAPAPATPAARALTAPDVEAWLDGFMPQALDTAEVPGAVVVVVKDGQVLFEKGYGYADYARRTPVDPRLTLFRPGSVSKLFTWTAVMQLVQAGKIDLDADVDRYLDFHIPAYRGIPVTMRDLMTHRGGFSETARDLLTFGKAPPPLGEVLKRYVPPRIFAPDEGPGYSNYGASVAGYIVQRISGEPFDAYVARHIFAPLGMTHSTFDQPLPAALKPDMAVGYRTWDHPGAGFEVIDLAPAGSLSSTGDDMSRFMIAHLGGGALGGQQILAPRTAQMMHTTAWKAFPDLNGNLLGFYQQNVNGHRVIAHGGDTDYFHSLLTLYIDDGVGVFVSVNGVGKAGMGEFLRDNLFNGFSDRYFPRATAETPVSVSPATAKAHAKMIAGLYMTTRRSDSTFLSMLRLIAPTVVTADPDGRISVAPLGRKETFYEVSPFLWRQFNGPDRLEATAQGGRVTRWGTDSSAPIWVYQRLDGLAGSGLAMPLTYGAIAFLFLVAVLWPTVAIVRWRYHAPFALTGRRAAAYRLTRLATALAVAALVAWLVVLQTVSGTNGVDVTLLLHTAQALAFVAYVGGTAVALWNLVLSFRPGERWTARLFAVATLTAFAMLLWFALACRLIGLGAEF